MLADLSGAGHKGHAIAGANYIGPHIDIQEELNSLGSGDGKAKKARRCVCMLL